MITVTASVSKDFFGEPIYLREVIKDVLSTALNIDRGDLHYTHVASTDEEPAASIVLTVDTAGTDEVATLIDAALVKTISPARLSFATRFTATATEMELDSSALEEAVQRRIDNTDTMVGIHASLIYEQGRGR